MKTEQRSRLIGGVEKLFLVLNRIAPKTFAMSAELDGILSVDQLKQFARAIQQRHPNLGAKLIVDEDQNYSFCYDDSRPLEVNVIEDPDPTRWKRLVESEIAKPFDLSEGPLFRFFMLTEETKIRIVLLAHHSIGDGFSMVNIFADLLRFLNGDFPANLPVPESMDQMLGIEDRKTADAKNEDIKSFQREYLDPEEGKIYIDSLKLDRQSSAAILEASRLNGVTFNGLLNAALAIAIVEKGYSRTNRVIALRTPASVRKVLSSENDFALNIVTRLTELKINSLPDLWELGRKVNGDLKNIGSKEETLEYVSQFRHLLFQPMEFEWFVNVIKSTGGIDLMLSNLGKIDLGDIGNELKITSLWGPMVIAGDGSEQTVGALSIGGALHLTHSSMEPVNGLLKKACEIILDNIS